MEPENDVLKESRKLLFQGVHFKFVHFLCAVPASKFLNTFPGSLLICHGENPRKFLPPKWDVLLLCPPPPKNESGSRICFFSSPAENWTNRKLFQQKNPKISQGLKARTHEGHIAGMVQRLTNRPLPRRKARGVSMSWANKGDLNSQSL